MKWIHSLIQFSMPVQNRERERQIVLEGRKQGKSDDFIKQAVLRDRQRGGISSSTLEQPKEGILKRVGKAIISSETGLANTLGGAMGVVSKDYKAAAKSQEGLDEMNFKLGQKIVEGKKQGQDVTRLQKLYQQNTKRVFDPSDITGGAIDKTGLQVLGEAGGVALDIATAGTYGAAAKTAKTGQFLTKSPLLARTAQAVGLGVTKPLAKKVVTPTVLSMGKTLGKVAKTASASAGVGYGYDVSQGLQEGERGVEALKPGWGTALGAVVPVGLAGVKAGGTKVVQKVIPGAEDAVKMFEKATDIRNPRVREFQDRFKKSIGRFLAEEQIPLQRMDDAAGTILDTTEARKVIQDRISKELQPQKIELLRQRPQMDFNIDEMAKDAISRASKTNNAETAIKMRNDIRRAVKAEKARYKTNLLNGEQVDRIKSGQWSLGYNMMRPTAKKSARIFGEVLKENIEKAYKGSAGEDIIRSLNAKEAQYLSALNTLAVRGGIHGKPIRGGLLGRALDVVAGRTAGAIVGTAVGGPFAGAAAAVGAGRVSGLLTDFFLNPERLTLKAMKVLQKKGNIPGYLKTLDEAKTFLQKLKEQVAPLALPQGAMRMPQARAQGYSGIIDAPAPTQLQPEIRPGQPALPPGRTSSEIPIPMYGGTQFEPRATKVGSAELPPIYRPPSLGAGAIPLPNEGVLAGQAKLRQPFRPPVIEGQIVPNLPKVSAPKEGLMSKLNDKGVTSLKPLLAGAGLATAGVTVPVLSRKDNSTGKFPVSKDREQSTEDYSPGKILEAISAHESRGAVSPSSTVNEDTGAIGSSQITMSMFREWQRKFAKDKKKAQATKFSSLKDNPELQKQIGEEAVAGILEKYSKGLDDWKANTPKLEKYKKEINRDFNSPIYWVAGEWIAGPNWVMKLDNKTALGGKETVRDYLRSVGSRFQN